MSQFLCYGTYPKAGGSLKQDCPNKGTPSCIMNMGNLKKLAEEPCYHAIFIPARFLSLADGDRKKAAEAYIKECLPE